MLKKGTITTTQEKNLESIKTMSTLKKTQFKNKVLRVLHNSNSKTQQYFLNDDDVYHLPRKSCWLSFSIINSHKYI